MSNLALFGDSDDSTQPHFGGFSNTDLEQFESIADQLGLTTTAFHQAEQCDSGIVHEEAWVSAHYPGDNPLETYEFRAYTPSGFEQQAQIYSETDNLSPDTSSATFGHFSEVELQQFETIANEVGLTTTAFDHGYISELDGEAVDGITWVNAHYPVQNPMQGQYEFNFHTSEEMQYKLGNWSTWHDTTPLE